MVVTGRGADDLYRQALEALVETPLGPSPRGQRTREIPCVALVLRDARDCVVTWRSRKLNYHFLVAEFFWIATGRDDVASIAPYNKKIADFSDDGVTFFGAYGPRWRPQAEWAATNLRADLESRQAVASTWRPCPPLTRDTPCTLSYQYLVRGGKLHSIVTMRSSDIFLGIPYDIFNAARLAACVAGAVGVPLGSLTMQLGSFHLYERNEAEARAVLAEDRATEGRVVLPDLPGFPPVEYGAIMASGFLMPRSFHPFWRDYIEVMSNRFAPDGARGGPVSDGNPFKWLLERGR